MKALTTLGFILLLTFSAFGQILTPVKWTMDHQSVGNDEFELIFTAKIDNGWKVYSQFLEEDDGPRPTSFVYEEGAHYAKVGKTEEAELNRKKVFDKVFEMEVITFSKVATFTQRVKIKDYSKPVVGYFEFMTCDATQCLPPMEEDFEFTLSLAVAAKEVVEEKKEIVEEKIAEKTSEAPKVVETVKEKANMTATNISDKINQVGTAAGTVVATTKEKATTIIEQAPTKIQQPVTKITEKIKPIVIAPVTMKDAVPEERIEDPALAAVENLGEVNMNMNEMDGGDSGILDPAHWTIAAKKITAEDYELTFTAKMDKGWYIYSQHTEDGGPIPTAFFYKKGAHYELVGDAKEIGKMKEAPEPAFGPDITVTKFVGGTATFVQIIKVTDINKAIKGEVEFMACNNETCTPPIAEPYSFVPATLVVNIGAAPAMAGAEGFDDEGPSIADGGPINADCGNNAVPEEGKGLWSIFVLGFFGGLLALLTPCVFPMIPLTVSFFTKGSQNKSKGLMNALLYGFFIFMVYILLSVPFHLMDSINPDILNEISTNVWLNIAFFFIFMFFAFSFFGYYELTLPEKWVSKSSNAEGTGGILGIFFMALTLALVSFSCTGPILGSLLAGALTSDGGANQLTAGMGGFGAALAFPFALFAMFPSMMNALPRSGG